jgi:hypothetical protein
LATDGAEYTDLRSILSVYSVLSVARDVREVRGPRERGAAAFDRPKDD